MNLDAEVIGENIRNIRKDAKQTQEEFAEEIGISTRSVSYIENGCVIPSLQTIVNIIEIFDCRLDKIICREESWMKNEILHY